MSTIESRDQAHALLEAVKAGDAGAVADLLQAHPSSAAARDGMGVSAIMHAAYRGREDLVDMIVEAKRDLDLVEAAATGREDIVARHLDEDPQRVHDYSPDGFPLIALAATFGDEPVVAMLIARGADVNAVSRNPTKYTALTGAVSQGRLGMARLLLEHGAHADYAYAMGSTPLHEASQNGSIAMAKLLLEHGAKPDARMQDGKTPVDLAVEKGHTELANLIRTYQRG